MTLTFGLKNYTGARRSVEESTADSCLDPETYKARVTSPRDAPFIRTLEHATEGQGTWDLIAYLRLT